MNFYSKTSISRMVCRKESQRLYKEGLAKCSLMITFRFIPNHRIIKKNVINMRRQSNNSRISYPVYGIIASLALLALV